MKVGILGGGAAGLSAAWFLRNSPIKFSVYEAAPQPGGMARSFRWHGCDCDLGPHRLFTRNPELRHELLRLVPMHRLPLRTQVYIQGKWLQDPLSAVDLVFKFFPGRSAAIVCTTSSAKRIRRRASRRWCSISTARA